MAEPGGCRLYLVTPPRLDPARFADLLAAALDAGDAAAVQLRLKGASEAEWRDAIEALRPVAQARDVAFLLNDRADLVRETGCDGAHVGQQDMPARQARALLGPDLTLGVTCCMLTALVFLPAVLRVLSRRKPSAPEGTEEVTVEATRVAA